MEYCDAKEKRADERTPIEVGESIAQRFMRIDPPRSTYMYAYGLNGLLYLWKATGEDQYFDFYMAHRDMFIRDFGHPNYDEMLYWATGDRKWLEGIEEVAESMLADEHVDSEGATLDPRGRYTVDTFSGHMCRPILYAHILNDHRFLDAAMLHYEVNKGYLADPVTGLWYSRLGHHMHQKRNSPGLWARGNGWLVQMWGTAMHLWDPNHHGHERMLGEWRKYCSSVSSYQTQSGLLRQLVDRDDCFEEASGSGLIFAGIANGVLHGTLPHEFGSVAYRGFCGIRGIVDTEGNIHNGSTTAGGYNFERQYYTCSRFNEPHADGGAMMLCSLVNLLLEKGMVSNNSQPEKKPEIVTTTVPGVLSYKPLPLKTAEEMAPTVLKRIRSLSELPENDLYGFIPLSLIHWYDWCKDGSLLADAERLLESATPRQSDTPHWKWNVKTELALRAEDQSPPDGLKAFADKALGKARRDRDGVFVDETGGYSTNTLFIWIPLLAKTSRLTGDLCYLDEACRQLFGHQAWLEEPITRLWYGTFGHGRHKRNINPGLWGVGNGYVISSIVELLDYLPREYDRWIDVICLLRDHVRAVAEYQPVNEGWTQLIDNIDSFHCPAANGLITYGFCKAMTRGWISDELYLNARHGMTAASELVDGEGNYGKVTMPTAGLDDLTDYESHSLENDPYGLGPVLSGLAASAEFYEKTEPPNKKGTLGVR